MSRRMKQKDFWIRVRREGVDGMEEVHGYIMEAHGMTFGCVRIAGTGWKVWHVLSGYSIIPSRSMDYPKNQQETVDAIDGFQPGFVKLIRQSVLRGCSISGEEFLAPGIRTLGAERVNEELDRYHQ